MTSRGRGSCDQQSGYGAAGLEGASRLCRAVCNGADLMGHLGCVGLCAMEQLDLKGLVGCVVLCAMEQLDLKGLLGCVGLCAMEQLDLKGTAIFGISMCSQNDDQRMSIL